MPDPTTNFGWDVPAVGGDNNAWGALLNIVFDDIDTDLQTVKVTADAAKVVTDAIGAADLLESTAKSIYIPYSAFQPEGDEDDTAYGDGSGAYLRLDDDSGSRAYSGLTLPVGATLTEVVLYCDKQGITSLTLNVLLVSLAGVVSTLGTGTNSAAGVSTATAAFSHVVAAGFLVLQVVPAGSTGGMFPRIYGAKVTYTKPTVAASI